MTRPTLALIAAVARNGAIGKDNDLLFGLPEDLQHFKRTTLGCPVIMGRKTWDSLPPRARPLPGRTNVVVTRNARWRGDGAVAATSLPDALAKMSGVAGKVFVIGGAELYKAALPLADELVLTEIDREFDGDVYFPPWDRGAFTEAKRENRHAGPPNDFDYAWVTYRRIAP